MSGSASAHQIVRFSLVGSGSFSGVRSLGYCFVGWLRFDIVVYREGE